MRSVGLIKASWFGWVFWSGRGSFAISSLGWSRPGSKFIGCVALCFGSWKRLRSSQHGTGTATKCEPKEFLVSWCFMMFYVPVRQQNSLLRVRPWTCEERQMQPTTGFIHAIVHLWLQGLNVRNVLRGRSIHARLCGHGGPASLGHCCSSGTFLKMWQHVPGYDMSGLMCHV